jgi:hypothetical protein
VRIASHEHVALAKEHHGGIDRLVVTDVAEATEQVLQVRVPSSSKRPRSMAALMAQVIS